MKAIHIVVAIIVIVSLGTSRAIGSIECDEGARRFDITMVPSEHTDKAGRWSLTVTTHSETRNDPRKATLHIEVGPGARVIKGETAARIRAAGYKFKRVGLERTGEERVRVAGRLQVEGPNASSYDIYEQVLDVRFEGANILVESNRTTVALSVINGRMFRYGGRYMVAVEADETELPEKVLSQAALVHGGKIECKGCGLESSLDLQIVVTVGRTGRVTWVRPGTIEGGSIDPKVQAAIEQGLQDFLFRPTMTPSGPISDYVELEIHVTPE